LTNTSSRDRPNWSSLPFSSTTPQNFAGTSYLLSEVSKFQHQQSCTPNVALHLFLPYIHVYI
jgi:hypothetical protein